MIAHKIDFNDGINVAIMMRMGIAETYSNEYKHLGRLSFLKLTFD